MPVFMLLAGYLGWRRGMRYLRGKGPDPENRWEFRARSWLGMLGDFGCARPLRVAGWLDIVIAGLFWGVGLIMVFEGLARRIMGW